MRHDFPQHPGFAGEWQCGTGATATLMVRLAGIMRIFSRLAGMALWGAVVMTGLRAAEYHVVQSAKVGGAGGFDYVTADPDERRLYIPRGNRVTVFDLDTVKPAGEIAEAKSVHGVAIDPSSHHAFSSSNPVVMWDTRTLAVLKTTPVQGSPDGILFEPLTHRVYVLSHRAPNVTVLDSATGEIAGTIDLGGAPEQAASDGNGKVFVDLEDRDRIAVVDAKTMKLTGQYELAGKGGTPAGLALDPKNHILFVCCRNPATCVVLNADTGKILETLPIGAGTDGAVFNPATNEAFSSNRDGTLTVMRENSGTAFAVTQNVPTKTGAKTCTLDPKTNRVLLITADYAVPTTPPAASPGGETKKGRGGRGAMVPDSFTILVVGK